MALTQFFHMLVLVNRALQPSQPQFLVLLFPPRCSLDACRTELYSMLERSKLNYWKLKVGELFQITVGLSLLISRYNQKRKNRMQDYKFIIYHWLHNILWFEACYCKHHNEKSNPSVVFRNTSSFFRFSICSCLLLQTTRVCDLTSLYLYVTKCK